MANLLIFNKPFQVLSQFSDNEGRDTLAKYITTPGVFPAGRLDYDSEGLLLLTDDGRLQHQISHPERKMKKRYWAQVEGDIGDEDLSPIRAGIELNDGPCKPCQAQIIQEPAIWPRNPPIRERQNIPTSWIELTLQEGRNRQVRRMTAAIGFPTLRLIRASIGDWSIENINPGEFIQQTIHMPQASKSKATAKNPRSASRRSKRRL